jgi:hypothetical protein
LPAPGANFLGNVNAFLLGFQKWHKFGDKLARLLRFEAASFFRHLDDDSLLFIKTFLWARSGGTTNFSAKFCGNFDTVGLWSVFGDRHGVFGTYSPGPFATLSSSTVALRNVLAFFFNYFFTVNNIVFDVMFVVRS